MASVLVLSCGGLGWPAAIRELHAADHRVTGVDTRLDHHGQYLTDAFYQVPPYSDVAAYVNAIESVIVVESIEYITGGHTMELAILQEHDVDATVLAADPSALRVTMDKHETYQRFATISPEHAVVTGPAELHGTAYDLGFPDRELCIKPVEGSGARGFRYLVEDYDQTHWTFEHKHDPYIRLDRLMELDFPPLLVMEVLDDPVYHVDILAQEGEVLKAVVSRRLEERFGFGFSLEIVDRPAYETIAEQVVDELDLEYTAFIQVMDDRLLEVGGRAQGSVGIALDHVSGAVSLAEGNEPDLVDPPDQMIRYWKELFLTGDDVWER